MEKFIPCFVIPNYNHTSVFEAVVIELCAFNIPLIVVNDGSNQQNTEKLRLIASKYPLIYLKELPENQGKGGAVKGGLHYAFDHSFTHALQVDADGQHNLNDIELFLTTAESNPQSLICGYPIYDDSVPAGRLIPRYITHFWVFIETLSFSIKDSMCGFRVYPLTEVMPVIESNKLGHRMDFDIEILVRSNWQAIEMMFLPTKVIYPENGISHFNLIEDNWLITKMHTRLFFGMLYRLPRIITNKFKSNNSNNRFLHWSAREEKGTSLGINILLWCYKFIGRRAFKLILHPVIAYFILTSFSAKKASLDYQKQLALYQKQSVDIGWKQAYRHFYQFGTAAIDKIGCWMGDIQEDNVTIHNDYINDELLEKRQGAIFIGSHLGNLELCRAIGQNRNGLVINAVVFDRHALKFQDALNKSNHMVQLNLIHVESVGIETAIVLKQKIEQGEVVIIVGDRTSVNSVGRVEYVDFLGKKAPFSQGPFILAGLLECSVYLIFCIHENNGYNIYLEPFEETLKLPRKNRKEILSAKIQKYANRLAFYCQKAPLQWFNFYDFWKLDNESVIRKKLG